MNPIHLTLVLLLLTCLSPTAARVTSFPESAWLTNLNALLLHPRANDANPQPDTFICTTTSTSPFQNHVLFGAEDMRRAQGHHWCTQESRDGCMKLIDYGTALVTMCGEYRTKLRCYHLADALTHLARACTKDTGAAGGRLRVSGRAVFGWGYLEIAGR